MSSNKIAILGAGTSGLALAIRLAVKGHVVTLYTHTPDKQHIIPELTGKGYRFDTMAMPFIMPLLVVDLLYLTNKNTLDYFSYKRLKSTGRYIYPDGTLVKGTNNPRLFSVELTRKLDIHPQKVWNHLQLSSLLYELIKPLALENSLHSKGAFMKPLAIKNLTQLLKIGINQPYATFNHKHLQNARATQLFNHFASFLGVNPYKANTLAHFIPHFARFRGTYFPTGGIKSINETLLRLAQEEKNIEIVYQKAEQIVCENKLVKGVDIGGQLTPYDTVVSNLNLDYTYQNLLPNTIEKPQQTNLSKPLVFYWGIKTKHRALGLHNIFFSDNDAAEYQHYSNEAAQTVYSDPTIYLYISAKEQASDAPKGCENWRVMVRVPYHFNEEDLKAVQAVKRVILNKLNKVLQINLQKQISLEVIGKSPSNGLHKGYGTLYQSNWKGATTNNFRASNFHPHIKGLYFCGESYQPGGGMPFNLWSAKIVEGLI